ncbi:MAG: hypothetical protein WBP81_10585 [Solirubrobacteraceae bacterium]
MGALRATWRASTIGRSVPVHAVARGKPMLGRKRGNARVAGEELELELPRPFTVAAIPVYAASSK